MEEKLRDYFEEMVVYKDLKNNNFFSSLGLPAFLRDYLLKTFSDDYGCVNMDEVSNFIKKFIAMSGLKIGRVEFSFKFTFIIFEINTIRIPYVKFLPN